MLRGEAAVEDVATALAEAVEVSGELAKEVLHKAGELGLVVDEQKVQMIGHDHDTEELDAWEAGTGAGQVDTDGGVDPGLGAKEEASLQAAGGDEPGGGRLEVAKGAAHQGPR